MKLGMGFIAAAVCIVAGLFIVTASSAAAEGKPSITSIANWEQKWEDVFGAADSGASRAVDGEWIRVSLPDKPAPELPKNRGAVSIRLELPDIGSHEGIYINKMFGQRVKISVDGQVLYSIDRKYPYEMNRILLPLDTDSSRKTLTIEAAAMTDRVGLSAGVMVGDYQQLQKLELRADLLDVFFGSALIVVALIMLVSVVFLGREQRRSWLSLSCMILSIGIVMNTYDPFLFMHYARFGQLLSHLFDVGLLVFLLSLLYFFETMFGSGYKGTIRKIRKFQTVYSIFSFACMIVNRLADYQFIDYYFLVSVTILGVFMVMDFVIVVSLTIYYAVKGSREAMILSAGIGLFALLGCGELIWFYITSETYDLQLWKLGVVGFVCSLIVLLCRKMAATHNKMIQYSKELEAFNQKLQRSEKIEIISQLAASVAHEVRNPLQVSRGFLQLLKERSSDRREHGFIDLAIEELDRASGIITNYLSFAKPQLEDVRTLHLCDELKDVEAMMVPSLNAQGGRIEMSVPTGLAVNGNAGKLKQVFVNLLKNSIEATSENGYIKIWAYEDKNIVFIHLQDNGEGMDETMLSRVGEPYLTNKTKGTGLGLMTTFQIIELMGGELRFKSARGVGTEAIISLPSVRL